MKKRAFYVPEKRKNDLVLSFEKCSRHGFECLCLTQPLDEHGVAGGVRLVGSKSCCFDRREVHRWYLTPEGARDLAQRILDEVAATEQKLAVPVQTRE